MAPLLSCFDERRIMPLVSNSLSRSRGSSCIPPAHAAVGASCSQAIRDIHKQAQHDKTASQLPPSIWHLPKTSKLLSPASPSSLHQTFRTIPLGSTPSAAATADSTPLLSPPAPLPAVPATPPVLIIQPGPPDTQLPPYTLEIPFSRPKTLVFQDATSQVENRHATRFETVVDILRQTVKSDSRLRQHASNIDYYLRMCGPSRPDMHPSVLVCCPPWLLRKLDKLFRKGPIARQYLRAVRDRRSILSPVAFLSTSGRNNPSAVSQYPSYDLYFWASNEPLRLMTNVDIIIAQSAPGSIAISGSDLSRTTLCGASLHRATGGARISTIGCLVQVDNKPYCLTTYHGMFGDPWRLSRSAQDQDSLNFIDSNSMFDGGSGDGGEDSDSEDFGGISYDLPAGADSHSASQSPLSSQDPVQTGSEVSLLPGESTRSGTINTNAAQFPNSSYDAHHHDWALLPLSGTTQILPNLYWDFQDSPQPRILDAVSDKEPGSGIDVYIIASQGRVKKRKLDSVPALLGALTYPHPHAIMWTIVMEQGDAIIPGDSGALVVARTAGTVYAHVVGVNAFGDVIASPFHETLRQVSNHFGLPAVGLPDSLKLTVELLAVVGPDGDAALVLGLLTVIGGEIRQRPDSELQSPFSGVSFDQGRFRLRFSALLSIGKCLRNPTWFVKNRALDLLGDQHMIPTETLNEIRIAAQQSGPQLKDIAAAILKEHEVSRSGSSGSSGSIVTQQGSNIQSTPAAILEGQKRGGSSSSSRGQSQSKISASEMPVPLEVYLKDYEKLEANRVFGNQMTGSFYRQAAAHAIRSFERDWASVVSHGEGSRSMKELHDTSEAGRHLDMNASEDHAGAYSESSSRL